MSAPDTISVQIIGAPVACADRVNETWRDVAKWAAQKLRVRYGTAVTVTYYDIFDPNCPPCPPESQLPLVRINGGVFPSGGKISLPAIRRHLDSLIAQPDNTKQNEME